MFFFFFWNMFVRVGVFNFFPLAFFAPGNRIWRPSKQTTTTVLRCSPFRRQSLASEKKPEIENALGVNWCIGDEIELNETKDGGGRNADFLYKLLTFLCYLNVQLSTLWGGEEWEEMICVPAFYLFVAKSLKRNKSRNYYIYSIRRRMSGACLWRFG